MYSEGDRVWVEVNGKELPMTIASVQDRGVIFARYNGAVHQTYDHLVRPRSGETMGAFQDYLSDLDW